MTPINCLTWLSDIHLEVLEDRDIEYFISTVKAHPGQGVLITGDISNAVRLEAALKKLSEGLSRPIWACLGNHDFWMGDFEGVGQIVANAQLNYANFTYLDGREIIPLTEKTALIGTNGWPSGTAGVGFRKTPWRLNDDQLVQDFARLPSDDARFALMLRLAKGYIEALRPTLREALRRFPNVIVATHVPPYVCACFHLGSISDGQHLPLFACPEFGVMVSTVSRDFPDRKVRIYCGHTHSPGVYTTGHVTVFSAGPSEYGFPRVAGLIEIE